jgi:hypothetical protein
VRWLTLGDLLSSGLAEGAYRPHAAREDTDLFSKLPALVSAHEYDAMGEQFEKEEHRLFGEDGFEKMADRVAELERAIGIYDLNQFTPACATSRSGLRRPMGWRRPGRDITIAKLHRAGHCGLRGGYQANNQNRMSIRAPSMSDSIRRPQGRRGVAPPKAGEIVAGGRSAAGRRQDRLGLYRR